MRDRFRNILTRFALGVYPICFVLLVLVDAPYILHTIVCAAILGLALLQIFAGRRRWQLVGVVALALYGVLFAEYLDLAKKDLRNEARVREIRQRADRTATPIPSEK